MLNPIRPDNECLVDYLKCGAVLQVGGLVSGWVPGEWIGKQVSERAQERESGTN